jgi:hypothetical protein
VMLPVHYMKLSPLRRTQRAQNRMVEHVDPASEARLALRDDRIIATIFPRSRYAPAPPTASLSAARSQVL